MDTVTWGAREHRYHAQNVAMISASPMCVFVRGKGGREEERVFPNILFLGNVNKMKSLGSGFMQSGQTSGFSFLQRLSFELRSPEAFGALKINQQVNNLNSSVCCSAPSVRSPWLLK